jgi:hypothetical protein
VRFNDYHKDVCRALELTDEEQRRAVRTLVMRCYANHHSVNAAVGIVKMERDNQAVVEALSAKARGLE